MGDTLTKVYVERLFQPPDIKIWVPPTVETTVKYRVKTGFTQNYETTDPNTGLPNPINLLPNYSDQGSLDANAAPSSFFAWDNPIPIGSSGSGSGSSAGTTTFTQVPTSQVEAYTVSVTIPGYFKIVTPPIQKLLSPNLGWNGSGLSESSFDGDGEITFKSSHNNVGIFCGFNKATDIDTGYSSFSHAFKIVKKSYIVYDNGQFTFGNIDYTESDVFSIKRINGVVTYYINGSLIYTSLITSSGVLVADASLYAADDRVIDATLTRSNYSRANITLGKFSVYSCEGSCGKANVTLAEFTVSAAKTNKIVLAEFKLYSTDRPRGKSSVTLAQFKVVADGGFIKISTGNAFGFLAVFAGYSRGTTRSTNYPTTVNLASLQTFSTDIANHGRVKKLTLATFKTTSYQLPSISDGVCNIIYDIDGTQGCGTLLDTGKHILTAAHVVYDMLIFNRIAINFYIPKNDIFVAANEVINVVIHPDYSGAIDEGNDLAIIYLKNEVTPLLARHKIYEGNNEVGQVYKKTTFSPRVDPQTGQVHESGWDITFNRYDDYADDLNTLLGVTIPAFSTLGYDFDNGQTINDAYGQLLGKTGTGLTNEGFVSPGDSGGAGMFNGYIAGLVSYGATLSLNTADVDTTLNSTYGEFAVDTRAAYFSTWINALISGTASGSLDFFDLRIQALGSTEYGIADLDFFGLSVSAYGSDSGQLDFFDIVVQATGVNDPYGVADLDFFDLDITATGLKGGLATGSLDLFDLSVSGYSADQGNLSFFETTISATGLTGSVGQASLGFISLDINATVLSPDFGVAKLDFFELELSWGEANLDFFALDIISDSRVIGKNNTIAYAINIVNTETTRYTNYDFEFIRRLGGKYYGVKSDGYYLLEGQDDNGVAIAASIKTSVMDFGTALHKRVPYLYLDSENATSIVPFVDEVAKATYISNFNGRRVQLGRGLKGRFWGFELSNVNGNDFKIGSIEALAQVLSRKV